MTIDDHHIPSENTPSRKRRATTVGLTGGLIAGTAVGLVFGLPGLTNAASDTAPSGAAPSVAVVGQASDPSGDQTSPARGDHLRAALQDLVDDGTITAEQADAVVAQLIENRPGREGRGERGPRPGFGAGVASEALTDLLDLDPQELRRQLHDGATLADIAMAQGIDAQTVVDELVGELSDRLDRAVENGHIDRAVADERLAEAVERISDMVNNGRPERGDRARDDVDPGPATDTED